MSVLSHRFRITVVFALAWVLASVSPASAIDPSAGTSGASFMKVGFGSARALALGRAYVALAEGTEAMTWNPAGLAQSQQREGAALVFPSGASQYVQDIDIYYFGYAHPLGRAVLGMNFGHMKIDGFDVRDEAGRKRSNEDVVVRDYFFTASLARSFWYEKVFIGEVSSTCPRTTTPQSMTSWSEISGLCSNPIPTWHSVSPSRISGPVPGPSRGPPAWGRPRDYWVC